MYVHVHVYIVHCILYLPLQAEWSDDNHFYCPFLVMFVV